MVGQMKKITRLAHGADRATSSCGRNSSKRRLNKRQQYKAKVPGFIVRYPTNPCATRRSSSETVELLAQLEAENAELRHRAVELALQIQKLVESQVR